MCMAQRIQVPIQFAPQQAQQQQRVAGGLIGRYRRMKLIEEVDVTWSWYDENAGIVEWTFKNNSDKTVTVALFRNGYYFGGAFWPVYLNYPDFNTQWLDHDPTPLQDQGVENNSPPLALLTNGSQYLVAFVFTLAPGQQWSMLEGGFIPGQLVPTGYMAVPLTFKGVGEYCIGYNPQAVAQWDWQTGTNMQGYQPNPKTFKVALFEVPPNAPFVDAFPPTVSAGACVEMCRPLWDMAIRQASQGLLQDALQYFAQYFACMGRTVDEWARKGTEALGKDIEDLLKDIEGLLRHIGGEKAVEALGKLKDKLKELS